MKLMDERENIKWNDDKNEKSNKKLYTTPPIKQHP
jgi:hypothetical protein